MFKSILLHSFQFYVQAVSIHRPIDNRKCTTIKIQPDTNNVLFDDQFPVPETSLPVLEAIFPVSEIPLSVPFNIFNELRTRLAAWCLRPRFHLRP